MPDVKQTFWIDSLVLERYVAQIRQCPLATYVKTMSDTKAVETTGTPWGFPDCDYPVAEANVEKGNICCFRKAHREAQIFHAAILSPAKLTVRTHCREMVSTCLSSHNGEVLKLKDDIVALLKGWVAPNGVVTRGRGTMLQLWSDNSSDLPAMLACRCFVFCYVVFVVGIATQSYAHIHLRSHVACIH